MKRTAALVSLILAATAVPCAAMQAAVEYGLKAGSGTLSEAAEGTHLGVCRLDSRLASCVWRAYPKVSLAIVAFLGLLLLRAFARGFRRT